MRLLLPAVGKADVIEKSGFLGDSGQGGPEELFIHHTCRRRIPRGFDFSQIEVFTDATFGRGSGLLPTAIPT